MQGKTMADERCELPADEIAADDAKQKPIDGESFIDLAGHAWIACCDTWWGEDAWTVPSSKMGNFKIIMNDCHGNCPTCGLSLRRHEHDREQSDGEFDL